MFLTSESNPVQLPIASIGRAVKLHFDRENDARLTPRILMVKAAVTRNRAIFEMT